MIAGFLNHQQYCIFMCFSPSYILSQESLFQTVDAPGGIRIRIFFCTEDSDSLWSNPGCHKMCIYSMLCVCVGVPGPQESMNYSNMANYRFSISPKVSVFFSRQPGRKKMWKHWWVSTITSMSLVKQHLFRGCQNPVKVGKDGIHIFMRGTLL